MKSKFVFLLWILILLLGCLCSCTKQWEDISIPAQQKKVFIISKRFTDPPALYSDHTWKPYKIVEEEIKGVGWQAYYGSKPDTIISTCSIDKIDSLFKIEIRIFDIR